MKMKSGKPSWKEIIAFAVGDGVSDLVMGSILDRTHTRWGKARPWILWTAIPMGLGLVIVFTIPSGLGDGAKMAWATITYILMAVVIYTA